MSIYLQNRGKAIQIGGGINQSVLDRIDALEQREQALKTELQEAKSELRSLKEQKAGTNLYGLAKISGDSTVTIDEGLVLSAKEKNASVPGSIASGVESIRGSVEDLGKRMICNPNIRDIAEIFDYRKYELALFSNWGNSSLAPKNFTMILRIPNLDFRGALCFCIGGSSLHVGDLNFANRTIQWTGK